MTGKKPTVYEILEMILDELRKLNEAMPKFNNAINNLPDDVKESLMTEDTNDIHSETTEEGKKMGGLFSRRKGKK